MADYKLTFHFVDGSSAIVWPSNKPEKIEEFNRELTATTYQAYIDSPVKGTVVNMKNVTIVEVEKVRED